MKIAVAAMGTQVAGHFGPVSYTHLDVYKRQGQCGDKWIGNFCPTPSNDPSCHRTRACCYYRCEGAAIPKKLLHDPS